MPLETVIDPPARPVPGKINIAAIRLPHISNFTDFNPLIRNPAVRFHYLSKPRSLEGYDAVFLPGTKNVRFDLQWMRDTGWEKPLQSHAQSGGQIAGICGGFQMLGSWVKDPHGVEGEPGDAAGFGLLEIETTLEKEKVLARSQGHLMEGECFVDGYEIHMGQTLLRSQAAPLIRLSSSNGVAATGTDGARNPSGNIWGTYFHGLFDFADFRNHFLQQIDSGYQQEDAQAAHEFKQEQYDLLAAHFQQHLNLNKLFEIARGQSPKNLS